MNCQSLEIQRVADGIVQRPRQVVRTINSIFIIPYEEKCLEYFGYNTKIFVHFLKHLAVCKNYICNEYHPGISDNELFNMQLT